MPGKGRAGVLPAGFGEANVPGDHGFAAGGQVVVGPGVAALEGVGWQIHMEGLDEVDPFAGEQPQHELRQPRAHIPLGDNDGAHRLAVG